MNGYRLYSQEELENVYADLVDWITRHPDDEESRKRLEEVEAELRRRKLIP